MVSLHVKSWLEFDKVLVKVSLINFNKQLSEALFIIQVRIFPSLFSVHVNFDDLSISRMDKQYLKRQQI